MTNSIARAVLIWLIPALLLIALPWRHASAGDMPGSEIMLPEDEVRDRFFAYMIGLVQVDTCGIVDAGDLASTLADFKGKVVLLDFWATWCAPCRQTIPHLEALHKKYKDQGLVVIGINNETDHDKVKAFARDRISYIILLDANKQFQEYGISGIPTAFYIDRAGKINYTEVGFTPGSEKKAEQKVKELLSIEE